MTNKERALRAIAGLPTDRPSVLPSIDVAYAPGCIGRKIGECFRDPQLHAQALMGALDRHPEIDGLYINLCLSDNHLKHISGRLYDDGHGLQWYVPEDDIGTVRRHEITELDDPRIDADTSLCIGPLETFAAIEPNYREQYLIVPGITGPYSQLVFMMGMENVMLMMYDDPDGLKEAIAKRVPFALKWLHALAEMGAEAVWLGEGAASSSVISPSAYAEFVAPYAKIVIQEAKRLGIPCFMHVCGDIRLSMTQILSTGTKAIDIDYMVPMSFAREQGGPDVCLKGNFNPISLFSESAERVFDLSRQILTETEGPVILGTGCLVAPHTPPENIDAMVSAAKSLA